MFENHNEIPSALEPFRDLHIYIYMNVCTHVLVHTIIRYIKIVYISEDGALNPSTRSIRRAR